MSENETKRKEFDTLKLKMEIIVRYACLENWFHGEDIFISVKNLNVKNLLVVNNPKIIFDRHASPRFIDIDLEYLNLILADIDGHVPAFLLHYLIFNLDIETQCIIFINDIYAVEISKPGHSLLPMSQESLLIGFSEISTFDFPEFSNQISGLLREKDEEALLETLMKYQKDLKYLLQEKSKLILKDYGFLVLGKSIEEAWYNAYMTYYVCQTQVKLGCGISSSNIILPNEQLQKEVRQLELDGTSNFLMVNSPSFDGISWAVGELEFEAAARSVDYIDSPLGYERN